MLARVYSGAIIGLDAELVEIEADIGQGTPKIFLVGLPAKEVQEAEERVKTAILNAGFVLPRHRVTINLAPANLRKEGSGYDLPMAISILVADGQIKADINTSLFAGELSLSGDLRPINGALSLAIMARQKGYRKLYLPAINAPEAALIDEIEVIPVPSLESLILHLLGEKTIEPIKVDLEQMDYLPSQFDMADVKGQHQAKRALQIAASGGHNILFSGPPGSGKTLLARTMPSILPHMSRDEMLEVTRIYSVAGLLTSGHNLIVHRPFRKPHHTSSSAALVGGGKIPRPGEISLAHRGVLFLDEFPEFSRISLEALRQPLEDGIITVSRASASLQYPASFILIAAMNPCPCGYATDPDKQCTCSPMKIMNYQKKISGPLLDRIDMHIEVPRLNYEKLTQTNQNTEYSENIRRLVEAARTIQSTRFQDSPTMYNAEMTAKEVEQYCILEEAARQIIKNAVERMNLSARTYHRLLKVARTIADLANVDLIGVDHIAEALQYRARVE